MKIRFFLTFLAAAVMTVSAQTQGYKDGIEYYKAGQYDNARTILTRTLNEPATDKALANYYLGQVALAQGDKAAAQRFFEAGLAADPENPYNYVGTGALALMNGDKSKAEDDFKQAQKLEKKNADISVQVARAYYNVDPVLYAEEIEKALEKARKTSKQREPAIYILEGDMLAAQGNYGDAAGRYETAITFDPANPEGYVQYANAYFNVNKDYALNMLRRFLAEQNPNSAMVQRELAEKLFRADRWREASQLYGQYIQNPNHFPEDKSRYAVLLYWGEDYNQSLSIAQQILAQDPGNFLMQRLQFLNQAALGQHQAAVDNARRFFASNVGGHFTPKDYTTYAEALSGLGQDSLAIVQYETAVERFPEDGDLLKDMSTIYSRAGRHDKAAEAYDRYLQTVENPSLTDRFGMAGRYLNAAVQADSIAAPQLAARGIEYISHVIENTPEVIPAMHQRLARLHIAGNNKKPNAPAIQAYDRMLEMLDADPENMNPANPNNALQMYKEAYAFEQFYASLNGDTEAATMWGEKYRNVMALINGTPAATQPE